MVICYLQVLAVLAKIDNWQFDCFELSEVSGGRPLSTLTFAIMHKMGLVPGLPGRCVGVLINNLLAHLITSTVRSSPKG